MATVVRVRNTGTAPVSFDDGRCRVVLPGEEVEVDERTARILERVATMERTAPPAPEPWTSPLVIPDGARTAP